VSGEGKGINVSLEEEIDFSSGGEKDYLCSGKGGGERGMGRNSLKGVGEKVTRSRAGEKVVTYSNDPRKVLCGGASLHYGKRRGDATAKGFSGEEKGGKSTAAGVPKNQ